MKVINLSIQNYLGVKAVDITPSDNIIKIEGKNGAGKSSVINAIWSAIGGKDELPKQPINNKADDGKIVVDLGDIVVERKFTQKGTYLEVKSGEGLKYSSPQKVLDTLFSKVSMSPQNFIDMKPNDRKELILKITGKQDDIDKLDTEYKELYDERTIENRLVRDLEGKVKDKPEISTVPDYKEEKSLSVLLENLNDLQKKKESIDDLQDKINLLKDGHSRRVSRIVDIDETIKQLEKEKELLLLEDNQDRDAVVFIKEELSKLNPDLVESGIENIKNEINSVESYNNDIKEYNDTIRKELDAAEKYFAFENELSDHKKNVSAINAKLEKIKGNKWNILKSANIGVDGLTVDGDELYINGIPFDDLSTKEKIIASMKIGIASNPKLKVLKIERGRELDSEAMAEVEKFAKDNDCQIWVELVSDESDGKGIFIEDGMIKE